MTRRRGSIFPAGGVKVSIQRERFAPEENG